MRVALVIAMALAGCTVANPAFDPEQEGELEPACRPGTPLDLVAFGFEPEACDGTIAIAGMVITQDEGAFTIVQCEDGCPCDADDGPELALALHPDIPIPVFTECISVHIEPTAHCDAQAVTIRGADERLLVHAESMRSSDNVAGVVVLESLVRECDCDECDDEALAPGDYEMSFASPEEVVGPLRAGEMAEIAMGDDDGATTWVVKALATAIDCGCAPRRALQWSMTRG